MAISTKHSFAGSYILPRGFQARGKGRDFYEREKKAYQLSDDSADAGAACERKFALLQDLRVALLVGMFHQGDDFCLLRVRHEIHGAAEALDLAGQHPVGQIAPGGHLHGTEHRHVDPPGPDHAEAFLGPEATGARVQRDRLFTGVDQVGILLALSRVRAQAEDAVLGLQLDLDAGVHKARREHGHADAQVGVHAVLELERGTLDDAFALRGRVALAQAVLDVGAFFLAEGELFNLLLGRALDHARDVNARQVHGDGVDLADLDNVLGLDDGELGVAAHGAVEVVGREPELAVAQLVGLVRLDERVVAGDGLLHDIALAVEHLDVARLAETRDAAVLVVSERDLARLHDGAERRGRVEGRDPLTSRCAAFGQRALRREFEFDLAGQVLLFEHLVLAHVRGDHLAHLARLEELAEPGAGDACVVGHGRETCDRGRFGHLVDERVGHAAQAKSAAEEGRIGLHVLDRLGGRGHDLVDFMPAQGRREGSCEEEVCL